MYGITVKAKDLPFARALGYRRRSARIIAQETVTFLNVNWSGGTKYEYHLVRLVDMETKSLAMLGDPAPWNNPAAGAKVAIQPGTVVVQAGWFCGKPAEMTVYVHPDNMARLLPSPD